tara:strand:+ start:292 stop:1008 length:717 start_codon:yes stop_codon:yes gene_type:complete
MSFQFTIKKCLISVDGKKYTKNEISIGNRYMFIHYGKPGKYTGRIMIDMTNPSEQVNVKKYSQSNPSILRFEWQGLWEDEDTGKESQKTLDFKIEFERSIDGHRVYLPLIGKKLEGKYKSKSVKKPRVTKRKAKRDESLKDIIKNVSDEKILQLMKGRSFDTEKKKILYQAKTWPEKYFTKGELIKYSKVKSKSKKKGRKGPEESATKYPVGTEKKGNDGNMWVINASKKGIQRWVKK